MHSIMMLAVFLLFAVAQDALACPETNGTNPRADMKAALDYYSGINESEIIAAADCALEQFEVSQQFEQAYKAEKSTLNYRYGRFLSEAADLQSRAADRVRQTGGGRGIGYYKRDIRIRTALLGWCLKDESACSINKELGALANAYEFAREATELHDWMVSNSPESLAVGAALDIWLRAVASCPAWDFHPGLKDSLYEWKETCSPACHEVAHDANRVLKEHGVQVSSLKPQVAALTKALTTCTKHPE